MNLSKSTKWVVVEAAASAGTTTLTTDIVDLAGYKGVMFVVLLGDVTDTSVLTLTVKGNSANSTSSPSPVTQGSCTFTAGATSADSKLMFVDVYDPALQYAFAELSRGTANAVVGGIIAILYSAEYCPTTQDATVIASAIAAGVAA